MADDYLILCQYSNSVVPHFDQDFGIILFIQECFESDYELLLIVWPRDDYQKKKTQFGIFQGD